ncbi:MAG: 4-hydroxy-tetrahydrodipicolinate reductase [Cyclobacteriaceae bacterium]
MKVAIVGYGKMGKAIEQLALEAGHEISMIIDADNTSDLDKISPDNTDVAIEFSQPETAYDNIATLLNKGVKVVAGTTGWLDKYDQVIDLCDKKQGTFLYASNFSLGVNLFFKLNEWLANEMNNLEGFKATMEEIHHLQKKDAPSGTAITTAERILSRSKNYNSWVNESTDDKGVLPIISLREENVPGTHTVTYSSPLETIEVKHIAHDRKVFAQGVVKVAEWVAGQQGVLTISEFLNSK